MKPRAKIQIRVPARIDGDLKEAVKPTGHRESIAFALVSHARTRHGLLVLVRKVVSLPPEAYVATADHGAKWKGEAMLPILNEALATNSGIVLFHVHQPRGAVGLSSDDRQSARQLLPVFQNLLPNRPHGSVVFSADHVAGMLLLPDNDEITEDLSLRWVGKVMVDIPGVLTSGDQAPHPDTYHRQMLLIGSRGQSLVRDATVVVVGLGGGGSHEVQQLAHMGFGRIIGVDHDRASESNRHRLIGIERIDVLLRRLKTKIMARMVRRINRSIRFEGVPFVIPDQRAIEALKEADVIIGCVDTVHARADLQSLAWRYLIPYIDVGLLIVPGVPGERDLAIGGNISTFIPGGPCGWCTGLISQEKLDGETGGRPRSYLKDMDAHAQVVSFNGLLASQAATDALQLVTGFAPPDKDDYIRKFDGVEGTLAKWIVKRKPSCTTCAEALAAGDVIWHAM